jgi:hypothetical protein
MSEPGKIILGAPLVRLRRDYRRSFPYQPSQCIMLERGLRGPGLKAVPLV